MNVGVDMVVFSDMMDGCVVVIRWVLDEVGYMVILIMSYVVKYYSVFYGFFCDVVGFVL